MLEYDGTFDPPAPVLRAMVSRSDRTRPRLFTTTLLDTGSDITAIPDNLVSPLDLYPIGRIQLEDVEGRRKIVYTFSIQLQVAGETIPYVEVITTGLDFMVLGRDVKQVGGLQGLGCRSDLA